MESVGTGSAQPEEARLEVVRMGVGPLQANAYLLLAGDEAVVVDPGGDGAQIQAELAQRGKRLSAIWLTHAHFDHVGGVAALLAAAAEAHSAEGHSAPAAGAVPVYLHPADKQLLANAAASAARWSITLEAPPTDTIDLAHGDALALAGVRAVALHTPGHAPGHVAFYFPAHGLVLSGDALFQGSIGRTDLPLGDHEQLLASIRRELLTLPDDTNVLPGHGAATTVLAERLGNPFL